MKQSPMSVVEPLWVRQDQGGISRISNQVAVAKTRCTTEEVTTAGETMRTPSGVYGIHNRPYRALTWESKPRGRPSVITTAICADQISTWTTYEAHFPN